MLIERDKWNELVELAKGAGEDDDYDDCVSAILERLLEIGEEEEG